MTELAEPPTRNIADAHTNIPALAGRKAIITGGTTGIGRAIAVLLASEGVKVLSADATRNICRMGSSVSVKSDKAMGSASILPTMMASIASSRRPETILAISTLPLSTQRSPPRASPR